MINIKFLIVEDDETTAMMIEALLLDQPGYEVKVAYDGTEAMEKFDQFKPDFVLLDINLPDISGLEVIASLRQGNWDGGIMVISGDTTMDMAMRATEIGADDFVTKPFNHGRLALSIKNMIEKKQLERLIQSYKSTSRTHFQDFIGSSASMQTVYRIIENCAQSDAPVFITGKSGSGKELAARAVHNLSSRRSAPFVVVNCAAIPTNLLESELFGHVKGSFTGAVSNRIGLAMQANKGTLFLDELGEMPMDLQPKLLRFIQTGTFFPVGSEVMQSVDIRFISATNRNPQKAIEEKLLREDLYYRLNVVPIDLPSLRFREKDVLLLARHFLKKI